MQTIDYLHVVEGLAAALVGVGGWLWRVAVKCHGYEVQLSALNAVVADLQAKHSADNTRIFARLDEISRDQAAAGAQIAHISETCTQIQNYFLGISAATLMPGGNRNYDPPAGARP